ncbi:MAG: hypothetical protein HY291_00185 [Planctomycetes bacterium]|nr:hypothetical protein [Planctomycetota bacterium]
MKTVSSLLFLVVLAALGPLSPALCAEGAGEAEKLEITSLIKKLSADDFETRESADKKLVALGEKALAALKEATKGGDPETQKRAAVIIDRIENSDEEGLLNTSEYYPLKVGTTWEYKTATQTLTAKVEAHEKVGDRLCAKVVTYLNGNPATAENISVRKDGIYRLAYNGQVVKPAVKVLPLPAKAGDEWKIDSIVLGQNLTGNYKTSEEKGVKVEGGTFDTMAIASDDTEAGGVKISQKMYFAKNVGMVKQTMNLNGQAIAIELSKFTPAGSEAKTSEKTEAKAQTEGVGPGGK